MVQKRIVLGHRLYRKMIEMDRKTIEVINKLPPPTSVKSTKSFLRHVEFYKSFIKDFSKISNLYASCCSIKDPLILMRTV